MAEKTTPFVINDRRKFNSEGELRHDVETPKPTSEPEVSAQSEKLTDAPSRPPAETIPFPSSPAPAQAQAAEPKTTGSDPIAFPGSEDDADLDESQMPPAPTAEQSEQAKRAYDATVDRLDTAIRASNPGADRVPEMSFDRFVQSLYMQTILQLGGGAEPGQQPQIDIIGARQTIDMLAILADKTKGNLEPQDDKLLQSALFEARMGFLEVTQAIARQAAGRQPGAPGAPGGGPGFIR